MNDLPRIALSPFPIGIAVVIAGAALASFGVAQVPTYEVQPVASFTATTVLRGASKAGHMVGWQVVGGQSVPFVATQASGLQLLPLPPGYMSGFATDVNTAGVIVGGVSGNGFPQSGGEPAIWTPIAGGGYSVTIPQQFTSLPSPLGPLQIQGGQAVAINDNGVIVGWSQYQGFQGGPTTRFFASGAPVNLSALGFTATVTDLSDTTDVIVGGPLRMDLGSGVVTNLGVPPQMPGGPNFANVLSYSVNDAGQSIVAARLATSSINYLTYRHSDVAGWTAHNPSVVPSVFPGFYDNNNLGDVAASGGVYFAAENVLVNGFNSLLAPGSTQWNVSLGFFGDDRRVYTTAQNAQTGANALVILVPETCQADLGFQGPGNATATLCGEGLAAGQASDYVVANAPPLTIGVASFSLQGFPNVPVFGGVAVSFTGTVLTTILFDGSGQATLPTAGVPGPAVDVVVQAAVYDPSLPQGFGLSNAILAHFGN